MRPDRRNVILSGAGLALAACAPGSAASPGRDVFAAGQPAALLIWALAPGRLIGWPRRPAPVALDLMSPGAATLAETGALASGGRPAGLEAVAALEPSLILDYGDLEPAYRAMAEQVRRRLSVDYRLIDGALERTPDALAEAGRLLGAVERGVRLADQARTILSGWRRPAGSGPQFYYARGGDGLETAFGDALAVQVLTGAGWTNVAVGGRELGRVSREQVAAWDPEIVVTLDSGFAEAAGQDPVWRRRRDGARRELLLLPEQPFGWIDRPPSINRLMGCAALSGASPQRLAELVALLFGRTPDRAQMAALTPRRIA